MFLLEDSVSLGQSLSIYTACPLPSPWKTNGGKAKGACSQDPPGKREKRALPRVMSGDITAVVSYRVAPFLGLVFVEMWLVLGFSGITRWHSLWDPRS